MEKNTFQSILIVTLVLGLLFSQSTAFVNEICKKDCHNKCLLKGSKSFETCTKDCLNACNSPSSLLTQNVKNAQYFCQLGCVSSLCANLSAEENPGDEMKMKGCMGYCSKTCTKN